MSEIRITCDRQNGLARAAVWRDRQISDLYIDSIEHPDLTGALVYGRVVRALPSRGEVFVDAGLERHLFLKSTARAGAWVTAQILSTQDEGKAWRARQVDNQDPNLPPTPWMRAVMDLKKEDKPQLLFEDSQDYQAGLALGFPCEKAKNPHPDLDEMIEGLLNPVQDFLIVEKTHAFTSIDVNGPLDKNPLSLNLQAAGAIARLLRLCNIGGLVVVDCLKMTARTEGPKLRQAFARALEQDPAKPQVYGPTRLGLIEIARPARGPSLHKIYGRV
ncbi:MAG: ribonuclease E/G [Alphaproteobacteria bacterium]|nr:ribonuclease E/G [Alphaproteobacteria bacterium]